MCVITVECSNDNENCWCSNAPGCVMLRRSDVGGIALFVPLLLQELLWNVKELPILRFYADHEISLEVNDHR